MRETGLIADPARPGHRDVVRLTVLPDLDEHAGDGHGLRRRRHRRRRDDHPADLRGDRPVGGFGDGAVDGDRRVALPAAASTPGWRRASPSLASVAIGAFMGLLVTRVGLHHFIVSLAVMVIARGLCLLAHGRPAAGPLLAAVELQVHRPGLGRSDPGRHHRLRGGGRRVRLHAAPDDGLPEGLLHRQQRKGGRLLRDPHQAGHLPDDHACARRSAASPESSTWPASAPRSRRSGSGWS